MGQSGHVHEMHTMIMQRRQALGLAVATGIAAAVTAPVGAASAQA